MLARQIVSRFHSSGRLAERALALASRSSVRPPSSSSSSSFGLVGAIRHHGGPSVGADASTVTITFVEADGETLTKVEARVGETLLQTAHRHDIALEGACEGVCACSTCHLIFPQQVYADLEDEISEEEEDMLDMAYGLTDTSRLGCQITVTQDFDGITVEMPKATRYVIKSGMEICNL